MSLKQLRLFNVAAFMVVAILVAIIFKIQADKPAPLNKEQIALINEISTKYRIDKAQAQMYVKEAYETGKSNKVDPTLILAIIKVESSFQANAKSKIGATGLMQVMPNVHKKKFEYYGGVSIAAHPIVNMRVGATILAEYIKHSKGNIRKALQAYNGDKKGTKYSIKVLQAKAEFEKVLDV